MAVIPTNVGRMRLGSLFTAQPVEPVQGVIHLLQQRLDQFSHRPDLIHPAHDLPYGIGCTSG